MHFECYFEIALLINDSSLSSLDVSFFFCLLNYIPLFTWNFFHEIRAAFCPQDNSPMMEPKLYSDCQLRDN